MDDVTKQKLRSDSLDLVTWLTSRIGELRLKLRHREAQAQRRGLTDEERDARRRQASGARLELERAERWLAAVAELRRPVLPGTPKEVTEAA